MIDEARQFIGMYGLRPIGGSLDSDDEEEREHRQHARDSRAFLNSIKMAEPPTRDQIRKVVEGKADTAVRRVQALVEAEAEHEPANAAQTPAASAPRAARAPRSTAAKPDTGSTRSTTRSSRAVDVDLATLESRVSGLLEKLTSVEEQLAQTADNAGLAARARVKDLERQRTTVLHTLAALEKARRLQTQ